MPIIFDLDGTLIDTKKAVFAAYEEAGIEMPEDAWGLHWREWLPELCGSWDEALTIHNMKNENYEEMLMKHGSLLPPAWAADIFHRSGYDVRVLTSASTPATTIAARVFDLPFRILGTEQSFESKAMLLKQMINENPRVIYVDDSDKMERVCKKIGVGFVHYVPPTNTTQMVGLIKEWIV